MDAASSLADTAVDGIRAATAVVVVVEIGGWSFAVIVGSVGRRARVVVVLVLEAAVQFGFQPTVVVVVVMDVVLVVGGVVFSMDDGADKDLSLLLLLVVAVPEVASRGCGIVAGMDAASSRGRWNRGLSLVKLLLLPLFVELLLLLVRLAAPIPRMRLACSTYVRGQCRAWVAIGPSPVPSRSLLS